MNTIIHHVKSTAHERPQTQSTWPTHTHRSHFRTMYFTSNGTKPDEKDWLYDSRAQILLEVGVKTVPQMMGYGKWWKHTSGRLSDTFQTTGRQNDFRSNHRRVICNYPIKICVF